MEFRSVQHQLYVTFLDRWTYTRTLTQEPRRVRNKSPSLIRTCKSLQSQADTGPCPAKTRPTPSPDGPFSLADFPGGGAYSETMAPAKTRSINSPYLERNMIFGIPHSCKSFGMLFDSETDSINLVAYPFPHSARPAILQTQRYMKLSSLDIQSATDTSTHCVGYGERPPPEDFGR